MPFLRQLTTACALSLVAGCGVFDVCREDIEVSGIVLLDGMPAEGWRVSAHGFGGPVSRLTNEDGVYTMRIDSERWPSRSLGNPTVRATPPSDVQVAQVFPETGAFGPTGHPLNCGSNPGLDFRFESIEPAIE